MDAQERPWERVPAEAYAALAPHLGELAEEVVAAIAAQVPEYAGPLADGPGAVRRGVQDALQHFVELARGGRSARGTVPADLGRGELRAGRSLDALLAAYRVGARVAWRRVAALGLEAGLAPETLVLLAESIFAYIDELSAESAEGFAREQAERAGELERRRRALVDLLVATPPADPAAVAAAADAAHWRLPAAVVVVVWREGTPALPPDAISASVEGLSCAVVPDRAPALQRALAGRAAGVGPAVGWADAARSFRLACAALALAEDRGEPRPLLADEHRVALLWRAEPALVAELVNERLAALADETPRSRARLEATLLAWLRHAGGVPAAAAELGVHPQTVRYRLGRLRELLGGALDDPDARFELELALRARAELPASSPHAGSPATAISGARATCRAAVSSAAPTPSPENPTAAHSAAVNPSTKAP